MTTAALAAALEREEGRAAAAYPDPLSPLGRACAAHGLKTTAYARLPPREAALDGAPWTIGVGHCGPEVKRGLRWSEAEIDAQLSRDIAAVSGGLDQALPWWRDLSGPRRDVLAQMGFQIGVAGVLRFRATLDHVRAGRYVEAAESMLKSAWARQTPARARRMAEQMRTGRAEGPGA